MNVHDSLAHLGYVLVRHRKHRIYRHPSGATVTTSSTPSDPRAAKNAIATARRELRRHGVLLTDRQ